MVSATVTVSALLASIAMQVYGIDANIMLSGRIAIAFGTMVDLGIIVSATTDAPLAEWEVDGRPAGSKRRVEVSNEAAREVAPAVVLRFSGDDSASLRAQFAVWQANP